MFAKNMMLFIATATALGTAAANGQPSGALGDLTLKITAARDIAALESFSEENVRLEHAGSNAIGGCVAGRDLPSGRVLEARDMICGGPALSLRRNDLDPRNL